MRFIDNSGLGDELGGDWRQRAKTAATDVAKQTTPTNRKARIDSHADVWREASPVLRRLSNEKCWYCEIKPLRSDRPVDHFRPKGRVAEDASHGGYWWLAFSWKNFRHSCTYCNSRRVDALNGTDGGKQDHFPLCPGSPRASSASDDVLIESPMLLDPCNRDDPLLLSFTQEGMPESWYSETENSIAYQRVHCSLRLYHLDHRELVEERKTVWKRVNSLVERGKRYAAEGGPLSDVKSDLLRMIQPDAPLSRVSYLAVRGRREIDWVRSWLHEVEPIW